MTKYEGSQNESKARPKEAGFVLDIDSKATTEAPLKPDETVLRSAVDASQCAGVKQERRSPLLDRESMRETETEKLLNFAKEAKPQTLPSVEVMQLARSWERRYAGWDTEILEARYFQWKNQGCRHDKDCLICVEAGPDHKCNTCQRAYHRDCLRARFRQKEKDSQARLIGTSVTPTWCCPLCIKRTWNSSRPKDALTRKHMIEKDERGLTLQRRFKRDPKYATTLTWTDNGTRECDVSLLFKLSAIDELRLQNALQVDKDFVKNHEMQKECVNSNANNETAELQLKAEEMEREIKILRQIQRLDSEREEVLSRKPKHKPARDRFYETFSDEEEYDDEYGFSYEHGRPDFMM